MLGAVISKAWNGIPMDRLHLWGRKDKKPVVPERTRAEREAEARRLREEEDNQG